MEKVTLLDFMGRGLCFSAQSHSSFEGTVT